LSPTKKTKLTVLKCAVRQPAAKFHLLRNRSTCYNPRMGSELKVGFLGAGKMATALAKGFIRAGLVNAQSVFASDPIETSRTHFANETGAKAGSSNADVLKSATVVFLAVKPNHVQEVLAAAKPTFTERHLLISIAAGVPIARMEAALAADTRVVRVMPNTPALVGESASAFALGKAARPEDAALVQKLLSSIGVAYEVKETLLDAVTGLSGSGPAYAFVLIEALSDGGVAAGLPRDVATRLAAQTLLGSAKMVLETGLHTGTLKDMVTSPGGTTIEGLQELERGGVRAALMNAVRAAAEKSRRLGQS
jgi:pyrroline-5-carboxylate reductase